MDISKYRQRLRGLFAKQMKLVDVFLGTRVLMKGGIYRSKSKCGKKGCKCEKEGELHEVWKFYWSEEGRTKIRSISKEEIFRYGKLTRNYRRFRWARAELVKLHREQIRLIDQIEKGLRKDEVK